MRFLKALKTLRKNSILDFCFWAAVLILCNLASIYLHVSHAWVPKGDLDNVVTSLILGFFLQLPLLAVLLLAGAIYHLLLGGLPRALYATALILPTSLTLAVFLAFYFSSEEMYANFNVFLSMGEFKILFTDTNQILKTAWHDASGKLILLVLLTLVIAPIRGVLAYTFLPRYGHIKVDMTARRAGMSVLIASIVVVSVLLNIVGVSTGHLTSSARYGSFPTTYALTAGFQSTFYSATIKGISRDRTLDDIISMDDYAKDAGTLESKANVFLILLESISYDHTGFAGYVRADITPNIDALARDSMTYTNAYAPSNHSNYAQTSIQSSQYPRRTRGLDFFERIDYPKTTLFDVLGHYGYETVVMSSQNENWQGMKRFLTHASKIDFFFHSPSALGDNVGTEMKLDDAVTRNRAERFIREREDDRPLFMYLNFQRTHFPYDLSESKDPARPYQPDGVDFKYSFFAYPPEKVDIVRNRFDNALRYVDRQVGEFIGFLKAEGLYEDSIIVLAPDHGEAFYGHGYPTHGTSLFDDQIRTFMLIKSVGGKVKGTNDSAVSLIDIPPTVLALLGLKPHPNFQGHNVLGGAQGGRRIFVTAQGVIPGDGVIEYPWKFIYTAKEGRRLVNVEMDPEETLDVSGQFPDKRKALERALRDYLLAQTGYYESSMVHSKYQPKY